jgi:hypothetical protein
MRSLILGLLVLSVVASLEAFACSCAPNPPPDQALTQAGAVFLGRALKVKPPAAPQGMVRVRFEVERTWKGIKNRHIVVETWDSSSMCGTAFTQGESYLVYAHADSQGKLRTSLCSRTRPESDAEEDLTILGEGEIPPPGLESFSDALLAAN